MIKDLLSDNPTVEECNNIISILNEMIAEYNSVIQDYKNEYNKDNSTMTSEDLEEACSFWEEAIKLANDNINYVLRIAHKLEKKEKCEEKRKKKLSKKIIKIVVGSAVAILVVVAGVVAVKYME